MRSKGSVLKPFEEATSSSFSVDERLLWSTNRRTKRPKDAAYSLLGIFELHMPLIYGEGPNNTMNRLIETIRDYYVDDHLQATGKDLTTAIQEGSPRFVEYLVRYEALVNYANEAANGETMLHMAVRVRHDTILNTLLEAKPRLDVFSRQGITPLMLTAIDGYPSAICKLLDAGCALDLCLRPTRQSPQGTIDLDNDITDGRTAVLLAAQNGHSDALQVLLKRGGSVNAMTTRGFTPLIAAAMHGHTACVELLLRYRVNVEAMIVGGFTHSISLLIPVIRRW
ncbi:putative vegetative incompatibility protein het-e-1 [Phaeomoniella chlamydospora]|uniref:Putative vegetative incompatibility protein het-e-1 n=1 Tax=Phaeomoniella chlamydospora TaxID=158046 RepID=A0A0G2EMT5_PHACM|nr:putative vegetative incompatibility protein het-e-1 [Phaeomoniella chlamydospora]